MLKDLREAFTSFLNFKKFLKQNRHLIFYLIFGILTTFVNLFAFWLLSTPIHMETIPATVLSWFVAIIFAFVTNKLWVFQSKARSAKETTKEAIAFLIARASTLLVEVIIMWITVDIFHQNKLLWKLLCNVITVILNYLFSKLFVFKQDINSGH